MNTHPFRIAGQPKSLVMKTLRDNPITVLAEHRFGDALGIRHASEAIFVADLLFEHLIAPVTCEACSVTHIGLTDAGKEIIASHMLPVLTEREFDTLLLQALQRIRDVAADRSSFPFLIDEVTLPQWRSGSVEDRSFVHVVVRLRDDRDVASGEHFSDDEQRLFNEARTLGMKLDDHVSRTAWLKNHYATMLDDSDPRICIVVEFEDAIG